MYLYRMISKNEENPSERELVELTREVVAIKTQDDEQPTINFIIEDPVNGYLKWPERIHGYCNIYGNDIFICRGLAPVTIIETTVHELRHAAQCRNPKMKHLPEAILERDARLAVREFWGSYSNAGDQETLTRTLHKILDDFDQVLWKAALIHARKFLKSGESESDRLRRECEPAIKARSTAMRKAIDPTNRHQFPPGIEFGFSQSDLTVIYPK